MAETIFIKKTALGAIVATERRSEDVISDWPVNTCLKAVVTKPRNIKHHAKYWAMLGKIFDNQKYFANIDDLHNAVKIKAGYSTVYQFKNGTYWHSLKSISFSKMSQQDFEQFYTRALDFISSEVVPGITSDEIRKEIEGFLQ